MVLDPQAKAFLDKVKALNKEPFHTLGAVKAREVYADRPDVIAPEWVPMFSVKNQVIEHGDHEIPIRIYTPFNMEQVQQLQPVSVFYHGGGMMIGTLDGYDTLCRQLSFQSGCIVVAVDYRLAPENKFPTAVDDAYSALVWVLDNAHDFNGDANNVAVVGDSAGGNLAAVVAILARDNQLTGLKFQLLIYPATASYANSTSQLSYGEGYFLERPTILWFHENYIRSDKDRQDFRYAPLITDSLHNLPPALVIVAEYDPLRDEGVAYAERLGESGVDVELKEYEGMFHPFVSFSGVLDAGKQAISLSAQALKAHLNAASPS